MTSNDLVIVIAGCVAVLAMAACDPACEVNVLDRNKSPIVVTQFQGTAVTVSSGGFAIIPGSVLDPKIQIGADVRHYAHPIVDYGVCRKYGRTLSPNVKTLFLSVTDSAAITLDDVRHEPLRPQPPGFPKTPQPQ